MGLLTEPKLIPAALARREAGTVTCEVEMSVRVMEEVGVLCSPRPAILTGFAFEALSFEADAFGDPPEGLPPMASKLDFREC